MQDSIRNAKLGLAVYVVAVEGHADRLAPSIKIFLGRGDKASADKLAHIVRGYRIGALEARANLVALGGEEQGAPPA